MSQYVGIGDDLTKQKMKHAKEGAQLKKQLSSSTSSSGGGSEVGGTPDMLVLGAAAAVVVGILAWKKFKKKG
jgi:hypothetical protein